MMQGRGSLRRSLGGSSALVSAAPPPLASVVSGLQKTRSCFAASMMSSSRRIRIRPSSSVCSSSRSGFQSERPAWSTTNLIHFTTRCVSNLGGLSGDEEEDGPSSSFIAAKKEYQGDAIKDTIEEEEDYHDDDYPFDFDGDKYSEEDPFSDFDHVVGRIGKRRRQRDDDKDEANSTNEGRRRLWLDPKSSIKDRVNIFAHHSPLGTMHPLDLSIGSIDLIRKSCKLDSFEGMKYAHDILDRLLEEKRHVNNELLEEAAAADGRLSMSSTQQQQRLPIVISDRPFKYVMFGWACLSRKVKDAPQRMREVLDLMIEEDRYDKEIRQAWEALLPRDEGDESVANEKESEVENDNEDDQVNMESSRGCEPTVDIYNTLLQGLSQAAKKSIAAAIEAEGVLSTMDKINQSRGWHTKPNTRSYSLVLGAYANTRHATAGDRAERVLRNMITRHVNEKHVYEEEYGVAYDMVDVSANERKIVTPDVVAYTTVIKAYAQSGAVGSADKALRLLSELIHTDNDEEREVHVPQPDAFAFATTIQAYARMSGNKRNLQERFNAAQRAEEIAWLMVEELRKSKQEYEGGTAGTRNPREESQCHPLVGSIVPFNAALSAWAQSYTPESAGRAESLLERLLEPEVQDLIEARPDVVSFNAVVQAWAKAAKSDESAPERAEEVLQLLQRLASQETATLTDENDVTSSADQKGTVWPDAQTFTAVMNAYAQSTRKDRIFHVRRLLKDFIHELPDKVTAIPYTILFKAVAKSDIEVTTSTGSPDWVLDVDAEESSIADPYSIALACYTDLVHPRDDFHAGYTSTPRLVADHFAFAAMLDVIKRHTDSESIERRQRVEEVFHDACQAGQVSSLVIKALQEACPSTSMLQDLLQQRGREAVSVSIESVNILPREWTRLVPPDFRRVSTRKEHFRKSSKHYQKQKTNNKNYRDGTGQNRRREKRFVSS